MGIYKSSAKRCPDCRYKNSLKIRSCIICSLDYRPTYNKQQCCGRLCGVKLRHTKNSFSTLSASRKLQLYLGKYSDKSKVPWEICKCGKTFIATVGFYSDNVSSSKKIRRKYCSKACKTAPFIPDNVWKIPEGFICHDFTVCGKCDKEFSYIRKRNIRFTCDRCKSGSDWISKKVRQSLYTRDSYICWLCKDGCDPKDVFGDLGPSLDHIIQRIDGGTDEPSNLKTAHRWCNSVRALMYPETIGITNAALY